MHELPENISVELNILVNKIIGFKGIWSSANSDMNTTNPLPNDSKPDKKDIWKHCGKRRNHFFFSQKVFLGEKQT